MRIGVNALYLIPGGVGGTEIYLRSLLTALAEIDHHNQYFVFTNRETGADLVPVQANFTHVPQAVRAVNRPFRLLWEQTVLPLRRRPPATRRPLQPRLHCTDSLQLSAGHRVSRSTAQTAPRIFPLVRSAVLEFLSVLEHHGVAHGRGRLRRYGGRPAALVPPAGLPEYGLCPRASIHDSSNSPPAAAPSRFF